MMKNKQDNTPLNVRDFRKDPPLLLKNFPYDELVEFLSLGTEEGFLEDEVIINGEEYIYTAYLIVAGKATILKNNISLIDLSVGDFLGETFLFSKYNKIAKVVSGGECRLLRFERSHTLDFFKKKPKKLFHIFTRNVITIQQAKLKKMNIQLLHLKKSLVNASEQQQK